ncbi:MAG: RDD family protein [Alphaproteobacteria bacterium]
MNKNIRYAGFWLRVAASIIDLVINLPWIVPLILLSEHMPLIVGEISVMIFWLYYSLFECSKLQGTPGKRALGIRVVDKELERLTWAESTLRFMCKSFSTLTLWIGYIMVAFTSKKQGLHDKLAKTYVIVDN